jgi:hypothetical protein
MGIPEFAFGVLIAIHCRVVIRPVKLNLSKLMLVLVRIVPKLVFHTLVHSLFDVQSFKMLLMQTKLNADYVVVASEKVEQHVKVSTIKTKETSDGRESAADKC